ncbi:hypothetical protein [Agrococcus sp. DT81.2]|uniref:hypothetical protein n=1 Tax=Agrococcus sp. DT81.2 TaxID=3393414 RepID=UPI003CE55E67
MREQGARRAALRSRWGWTAVLGWLTATGLGTVLSWTLLIGDAVQGTGAATTLILGIVASCLFASGLVWLLGILLPQRRRLRRLRDQHPGALVFAAATSGHFLYELSLARGVLVDGDPGTTPSVVVDVRGLTFYRGFLRNRFGWHLPWGEIADVTSGRSWYGMPIVHPTVDLHVRAGDGVVTVGLAPTREDWRFGATTSRVSDVQELAARISAFAPERARP